MTEKNYSAFENLNLNDTRSKNETREEYKLRLKRNRQIMKIYDKVGREQFQLMFPEGVGYDVFKQPSKTQYIFELVSLCSSASFKICRDPSFKPKAFLIINNILPGVMVIFVFLFIFKKVCLS